MSRELCERCFWGRCLLGFHAGVLYCALAGLGGLFVFRLPRALPCGNSGYTIPNEDLSGHVPQILFRADWFLDLGLAEWRFGLNWGYTIPNGVVRDIVSRLIGSCPSSSCPGTRSRNKNFGSCPLDAMSRFWGLVALAGGDW